MSIEFEAGKYYTMITTRYLDVSKMVMARDRCNHTYLQAMPPTGDLYVPNQMLYRYRLATEAESATWHEQRVAYLHNAWSCRREEADNAKWALDKAEKEERTFKLGLAVPAADCS
jgi:hypothetical protein